MKTAKRVVITLEVGTTLPIRELRKAKYVKLSSDLGEVIGTVLVEQIQANVIRPGHDSAKK